MTRSPLRLSAVLLLLLFGLTGCKMIDYPGLVTSRKTEVIELPSIPQQIHRNILSVGFSDFNREHGYVKVSLDFSDDSFRTVSIESFDKLGQPKSEYYDYAPHQAALGLITRLRSLGPSRIAELDAISGATTTVNQIKQAALRAEQQARSKKDSDKMYYDGTFIGISDRLMRGWTMAIVTISNDKISHVLLQGVRPATETLSDGTTQELLDDQGDFIYLVSGADYPWKEYHQAVTTLEKRFVEAGAANIAAVDTVSRATITSTEAKIAVQRALDSARR